MSHETYKQLAESLPTRHVGKDIVFLSNTESTNDYSRKMIMISEGGTPEGTVVVAGRQTKGRGRFDRVWHSPGEGGAYLSAILTPPLELKKALSAISLLAGSAVVEALEGLVDVRFSLKYPNDIYLSGRKAGGILTERLGGLKGERGRMFVIVGVGVNLSTDMGLLPPDVRERSTTVLARTGVKITPWEFVYAFCVRLEARYDDFLKRNFGRIVECWRERLIDIPEEAEAKLRNLMEMRGDRRDRPDSSA